MSIAPAFKMSLEKNGYFKKIRNGDAVIDLVCGMEISRKDTKFKRTYKGKKYFFCSEPCKYHFDFDPDKYAE